MIDNSFIWIKTKWLLNKKKDIFWRLQHRALPLGYRLTHLNQEGLNDCPNCPGITQTLEHFALKCNISKIIWKTVYKALPNSAENNPPKNINEILQATNFENKQKRKVAIWLHINAIYEIWYWYTQARWGDNTITESIIENITRIRLKKSLKIL